MGNFGEVHGSGAHLCHFYKGLSPIFNNKISEFRPALEEDWSQKR